MSLEERMEQVGISKDDLTTFVSPIVKEAIVSELGGIIQDVVRQEIKPVVESIPQQISEAVPKLVAQQFEGISDEIKNKTDERLNKVLETANNPGGNKKGDIRDEISPATKEKLLNKFIDKALGTDDDKLITDIAKLVEKQQALNTAFQAAGIYQPGPEVIWKAYQDATGKLYGSLLRGGGFPLPVVDSTKKGLSTSSPQSESRDNSSKKSGVFDRFLN